MATISAGELTNLRDTKHSSKFYLSVLNPPDLLTARVNNAAISRGDRSIAYDTGSSSNFSAIAWGVTLWVGTTAGDNDIGITWVQSISGTASSGTLTLPENGIDWVDNAHLTIKHNWEIWAVPPRIDSGIFYKFYSVTYSNQNSLIVPVAIGGPHQAGFLSGGSLILNVPVADSYAVASGASISTKSVTVDPSTGVTVGAESGGVIPVTYTAAGTYWVKTTANDSNGKSQNTYRVHFVYDDNNLPYTEFEVSGISGDWSSGGYSFDVAAFGDVELSDFPDGALCLLWREGRYDNTEGYANIWDIGDNILCCGYIRTDSQQQDFTDGVGQVSFSVGTPESILANRSEMGTVSIEAVSSPGVWYQYASWLTVGRAVHHLLRYHSTLFLTCDVYGLLENTLGVEVAEFSEDSLLARVNGFAYQRGIFAKMVSDRLGRLHFTEDIQMFNETNRGNEDTIFAIEKKDLGGQVTISRESDNRASLAFIDGFSFNGTTATALISIAGGYIDGGGTSIQVPESTGSGSINKTKQVLNSQADSNEKCGRVLAAANNKLREIRVPLRGDYSGVFEIVPKNGWYQWNLADADLARNLPINSENFLCRRVQNRLSVSDGTIETDIILEKEAFGPDGIPGNYPTSYPAPSAPAPNWDIPEDGATYGYFAGGLTSGAVVVTADDITFSTGVTAANTDSDLSQARQNLAGVSDTATYGYFAGGNTTVAGSGRVTTTDRITFSTGVTAANTDSDLSQARRFFSGLSDGATYGYFAGGNSGLPVDTADRVTFSTGVTAANTDSDLSSDRAGSGGLSDGAV